MEHGTKPSTKYEPRTFSLVVKTLLWSFSFDFSLKEVLDKAVATIVGTLKTEHSSCINTVYYYCLLITELNFLFPFSLNLHVYPSTVLNTMKLEILEPLHWLML